MHSDNLSRMANQIAAFFSAYPDGEAIEGVRDHLTKFWDPAMRRELIVIAAAPGHSLHPLVVQAVTVLRQR
jgi:formate dehydrogenase subunit delta